MDLQTLTIVAAIAGGQHPAWLRAVVAIECLFRFAPVVAAKIKALGTRWRRPPSTTRVTLTKTAGQPFATADALMHHIARLPQATALRLLPDGEMVLDNARPVTIAPDVHVRVLRRTRTRWTVHVFSERRTPADILDVLARLVKTHEQQRDVEDLT